MFRTVIKGGRTIKKFVRLNATRALSSECAKNIKLRSLSNSANGTLHLHPCVHNVVRYYCSSNLPGHVRVLLPALSPTMEEGTLISWGKKEGDKLNEGDLLAEIETDKATMAFETPEEGYLAKILIPAGTKGVPVGKLVCIIVETESDIAVFKDYKDDGPVAQKQPVAPAPVPAAATPSARPPPAPVQPPSQTAAEAAGTDASRVYASPMARKLAEQRNIRLQGKGTGLFESITSADLDRFTAGTASVPGISQPATMPRPSPTTVIPGTAAYQDIPLTNIRAVIAKRLLESKLTIPHYYVTIEFNADRISAFRDKHNKKLEKEKIKLSINDYVIKALALASVEVPEANSAWLGNAIRQYKNVDVSVAVATDRGLITPIIFEANNKGIIKIHKEMKVLAAKARDGKLQPHEFQGGSISLSNLGMFGVDEFTAIINPPQSCILAVSTLNSRLIIDDSTEKGFRESKSMKVTLSSDHRVVDGAIAARWMLAFRGFMEDPETMIL